jgi:secondary thiamine-phosphate synthase enzyme
MKTHTKYIIIRTEKEKEILNITDKVQEEIEKSGIKEGIVLVNSMHITSSIFINDEESGLKEDFMEWLEKLAPEGDYKHHQTGETNADAHLKRTIMGRESVVAITNGKLDFGPWEQIFYGEFDGRRDKRVLVKVIGE